jgi:hypothetical protein
MQIKPAAVNVPISAEVIEAIWSDARTYDGFNPEYFEILSDEPGFGLHVHDAECPAICYRDCDNSDRVVTVRYSFRWEIVYGVLDDKITTWMN